MPQQLFLQERFNTPTGPLLLVSDAQQCIRALDWLDKEQRMHDLLRRYYGANNVQLREVAQASKAQQALLAYFEGDLSAIDKLPTATTGTDFQRTVWDALRRIPSGHTLSYGELALQIGRPNACRAVGMANGSNPISIVVPCHRVIGANASLTGYGGGVERKRWLLDHELGLPHANLAVQPVQLAMAIELD